jgi:flavin-dependent dehydrogenase
MTVPLIGSGIANSLKAAKMLADTVSADSSFSFSAETLWKYQVKYYKELGSGLAPLECVKYMLLSLTPDELDYCFDSGMLNEDNITMTANFTSIKTQFKLDPKDLMIKATSVCKRPEVLKKVMVCGIRMAQVMSACAVMPRKWNRKAVMKWAEIYSSPFEAYTN